VIAKALEKKPENRFPSAADFAEALKPFSSQSKGYTGMMPGPAPSSPGTGGPVSQGAAPMSAGGPQSVQTKTVKMAAQVAPAAAGKETVRDGMPQPAPSFSNNGQAGARPPAGMGPPGGAPMSGGAPGAPVPSGPPNMSAPNGPMSGPAGMMPGQAQVNKAMARTAPMNAVPDVTSAQKAKTPIVLLIGVAIACLLAGVLLTVIVLKFLG
jgi:hypothetical protein